MGRDQRYVVRGGRSELGLRISSTGVRGGRGGQGIGICSVGVRGGRGG